MLRSVVVLIGALALSACDSESSNEQEPAASKAEQSAPQSAETGGAAAEPQAEAEPAAHSQQGAMPKVCERAGPPSATDLGLVEADFVACLDILLGMLPLPEEIDTKIQSKGGGAYEVPGLMMLSIQADAGKIRAMDAFFLNEHREKHGPNPELLAQFATLAIVFPSAGVEPSKGEAMFKEVDAIGRKTNNPVIDYDKDGIALNASFLPVSVRYQFKPKP